MHPHTLLCELASGEALSGAALARRLGLTRAAVWKHIEYLRARGLPVLAQKGAGYRLPWPIQLLDVERVRAGLGGLRPGALEVHWELDSTSSELQRRGADAPDFSVILAETQLAGRGRRGRGWLSPPGVNLYLSCLKRFDSGFAALSGLSLTVGVAVLRALERLGIDGAGLKWPNDVLTRDGHAKLAGILVELSGEYQGPSAAVIGIGLNLRLPDAARAAAGQAVADLAELAGGTPPDRNRVAATLIVELHRALETFAREGFAGFVDDFAGHDLLCGRALRAQGPREQIEGVGEGVDARGALRLRRADGELLRIDSADVSVRAQ